MERRRREDKGRRRDEKGRGRRRREEDKGRRRRGGEEGRRERRGGDEEGRIREGGDEDGRREGEGEETKKGRKGGVLLFGGWGKWALSEQSSTFREVLQVSEHSHNYTMILLLKVLSFIALQPHHILARTCARTHTHTVQHISSIISVAVRSH